MQYYFIMQPSLGDCIKRCTPSVRLSVRPSKYFLDNWRRENVCTVGQSCGTKTLWRLIWSSVASTRRPRVITLRIAQPGEICATKQSPSSKIRESRLGNIKEQFGRGSTSQQPQRLAMWQLLSRLQLQNWTPRLSTNSPMTSDPSFSTAQSVPFRSFRSVHPASPIFSKQESRKNV